MAFLKRLLPVLLAFLVLGPQAFAQSKTHKLTITSNVKGAQIQIVAKRGGGESGLTDMTFNLAPGEYSVRVVADGYKAEARAVSLRKDETIHFNLQRSSGSQEESSGGVYKLKVSCNILDARVKVSAGNGTQQGPVNTVFNVPGGQVTIEVSAPGFETKRVTVKVNRDQTVQVDLNSSVQIRQYNLQVRSNVRDASVAIEGNGTVLNVSVGQTVRLDGGNYRITVSASGYSSNSVSLNLDRDQRIQIDLAAASHQLTVRSDRKNTRIEISGNGVSMSGTTEFRATLNPGRYTVTASAPGFGSETREVNLYSDQVVEFNMRRANGTVLIYLSGRAVTKRDLQGRDKLEIYDNGQRLPGDSYEFELPAGQHTIQIVSGALQSQVTLNIEPGRTYIIEPMMNISVR